MAIVIKDGNNSSLNLKATYVAADTEYIPHHKVDGVIAVSGQVTIQSGYVFSTGILAVSGQFPSGVQYPMGTTAAATNVGAIGLAQKPDGSLSGFRQSTSGSIFVTPKYFEPNIVVNNVSTISNSADTEILAAPSPTSKRYFITSLSASNASSTGVTCTLKNNSQNVFAAYVAESGGGIAMSMPTPIICSTGTSVVAALGQSTQSIIITLQGYLE